MVKLCGDIPYIQRTSTEQYITVLLYTGVMISKMKLSLNRQNGQNKNSTYHEQIMHLFVK